MIWLIRDITAGFDAKAIGYAATDATVAVLAASPR